MYVFTLMCIVEWVNVCWSCGCGGVWQSLTREVTSVCSCKFSHAHKLIVPPILQFKIIPEIKNKLILHAYTLFVYVFILISFLLVE